MARRLFTNRDMIQLDDVFYSIQETINEVQVIAMNYPEDIVPPERLALVVQKLTELFYLREVDDEFFIPDLLNGTETILRFWLPKFGVDSRRLPYWEESVHTFDSGFDDYTIESTIPGSINNHEDDFLGAVLLLGEVNGRTQNLDELAGLGHVGGNPEENFEAFLDDITE